MPRSSPAAEYPPRTLSGRLEAFASTTANVSSRGNSDGHASGLQQATTLPPVASLTGYGAGPPPTTLSTSIGSPAAIRHLGVHSILNPTAEAETQIQAHRVSQSSGGSRSIAYGANQTPLLSPRSRKRKDDALSRGPSQMPSDGRQGRRMLTPKSPALRSMSQAVRGSPSGVAPLRSSLGPVEGRMYFAEPGETAGGVIPPLPSFSTAPQGAYTAAQSNEHLLGSAPASHNNTATPYPGNHQGYVESPSSSSIVAEREHPSPYQTSISDSGPQTSTATEPQSRTPARSYGLGQPSYQMQLSTDQGPMILGVEVDVQQASKMADEKRKRNAGASARFRQRRKEKEQVAASTIGELRRQIREITEDRDFYLGERNLLRDLVARTPGVQLPPRPPSPRLGRSQSAARYARSEESPGLDYERHDTTEPSPAQRRRTSDYQRPFATAPTASLNYPPTYPAPQPSAYALPPPMQDQRAQSSGALPSGHPGLPSYLGHPPPPPNMRPQYEPFRRDPNTR
ncbi:hypothetical protein LTR70_000719 [Exophiala xenobiotica]|uniref:BZIP domain-containing protein n=1 Tax=Lithohypha guttulata TaxID=1690604 RepID=A0ABR0KNN8_9EURO|nr:hypothetical protein LTR24_000610 [Lithohypha guttulata]KAK5329222.1 hypothetical protein LTR70_000719 [Exophiala xenobiotica]